MGDAQEKDDQGGLYGGLNLEGRAAGGWEENGFIASRQAKKNKDAGYSDSPCGAMHSARAAFLLIEPFVVEMVLDVAVVAVAEEQGETDGDQGDDGHQIRPADEGEENPDADVHRLWRNEAQKRAGSRGKG